MDTAVIRPDTVKLYKVRSDTARYLLASFTVIKAGVKVLLFITKKKGWLFQPAFLCVEIIQVYQFKELKELPCEPPRGVKGEPNFGLDPNEYPLPRVLKELPLVP